MTSGSNRAVLSTSGAGSGLGLELDPNAAASAEFLTMTIGAQMFGIPVLQVQDVLREQSVTRIPLAPAEISGALNLRGRIVTAINMRQRLGMDVGVNATISTVKDQNNAQSHIRNMSIVVEQNNELYSLVIDRVGDVITLDQERFEAVPATLDPLWREISSAVVRLEEQLLIILDVSRLLAMRENERPSSAAASHPASSMP